MEHWEQVKWTRCTESYCRDMSKNTLANASSLCIQSCGGNRVANHHRSALDTVLETFAGRIRVTNPRKSSRVSTGRASIGMKVFNRMGNYA